MIDFSNYPPFVKKIAGLVLFAIGLAFLGLLIRNIATDFPIWFFGRSASGVVEEKWYELIEQESNEFAADYFMSYSFTDPAGEIISGSTQLSAQEWSAYVEGNPVPVVYSPLDSSNNRVDDSRFIPLLLCAYVPFIFLIWFSLKTGRNIISEEFKKIETDPWIVENKAN